MILFKSIIKGDYLQRTRSYAFLVTLAISLYLAYTFLPAADANYSTVKIGNYVGENNATWIGYVTAIMTSIFLSLIGFYLVNNSIKKDIETEVGMIIATTQISNFKYLLSKMLSNFLVLLTITGIVFAMGIILFFVRSNGADFNIVQFVLPYLLTTLPAIFFIAAFAIVSEVFLGRWLALHYMSFFFLFGIITANILPGGGSTLKMILDPFGVKVVTMGMESFVQQHFDAKATVSSIGFNFSAKKELKTFVFNGMPWPALYIVSRLIWVALSVALVFIASLFFNRFDAKAVIKVKKKKKNLTENLPAGNLLQDIKIAALPAISTDYGILPFIKTELLMLFRKGPKWFWVLNIGGMIALLFTTLNIAHQFVLPALWFLQVGRLSDLTTKEKTNRIHYFTYASYKPIERLLPSQIIAGIILMAGLALPLMVRYLAGGEFMPVIYLLAGAIFIVLLAAALGILTGGKKLFEILFFAITYTNLNSIPFADYFGALNNSSAYLSLMLLMISGLIITGFTIRKYEIRHL
ncbi:hypothetical protein [Limnovirga soli]|uniref:Uncharacterized protein n=1 Tax=Limnovirga soli TaxID=2656915 RepID=A0A8J8FEY7_9BACT|nr:hypothetical protein [Limnovirga soli]NNV55124.1 hypothetical protein [Limnovirga soli]